MNGLELQGKEFQAQSLPRSEPALHVGQRRIKETCVNLPVAQVKKACYPKLRSAQPSRRKSFSVSHNIHDECLTRHSQYHGNPRWGAIYQWNYITRCLCHFSNESLWKGGPVWKTEVFPAWADSVLKVISPWCAMPLSSPPPHTQTHTPILHGVDESLDSIKHLTKLFSLRKSMVLLPRPGHHANNRLWNEGPN